MIRAVLSKTGIEVKVRTSDATPEAPLYKISAKEYYDTAFITLKLAPTADGLVPSNTLVPSDNVTPGRPKYRAIRINPVSNSHADFKLSTRLGLICGEDRCGYQSASLAVTSGEIEVDLTYAELDEVANVNHQQYVHYYTDEGWH
jgi:hypothetical protein